MLALITGRGRVPVTVAASQRKPPLVCALVGNHPDDLEPNLEFRLENLGGLLMQLKSQGVSEVCFCGAISRPTIDEKQIDTQTKRFATILKAATSAGEDRAFRLILGIFEESGFAVRAADDLVPSLLPTAGVPTLCGVPDSLASDIEVAERVLRAQARLDVGQACVIKDGIVLAREDDKGTDCMLANLTHATRGGERSAKTVTEDAANLESNLVVGQTAITPGGFLFKAAKPGQDLRVDLPTIGPITAMRSAEAGLDGIVIVAGEVIVLEFDQVVSILDAAGMYLWVR